MPYIFSLKVEQLRSIAWYYANAAVNTDKSDRHLIDFFRLKRADLQNHITNTIGLTEISDADLEERRKEWMRCKDTAKAVLDDLINNPPHIVNSNNGNNNNDNNNSNNNDHQQQRASIHEEMIADNIWKRIAAKMEAMNRQPSTNDDRCNKSSKQQKRDREEKDDDEHTDSDDVLDETDDRHESISISNKRTKQLNSTSATTSTPQTNSINYTGHSMNITNNSVQQHIQHQVQQPRNILSQSIPDCSLDTDLMQITQSIMDKAKQGQYFDNIAYLLQRKKSSKGSASADGGILLKQNKDGTVRVIDEDGDPTSSSLGQRRTLDSFSRLAEIMINVLIGKIYRDDQQYAADILSLFSLAISIDRVYSWRTAQYYVEAALTKKHKYPSFNLTEIDSEILNAVSRRANDVNSSYYNDNNGNHSNSRSNQQNQNRPHNRWNNNNHNNNNNTNNSNSNSSSNGTNSTEICRKFNRFKDCSHGNSCIYKHICSMCGDTKHGAYACPSKGKENDKKKPG